MARGSRRRNRRLFLRPLQLLIGLSMKFKRIKPAQQYNKHGYWGDLPSAQCGAVGGQMVRRMIEAAQRSLVEGTMAGVKAGSRPVLLSRVARPSTDRLRSRADKLQSTYSACVAYNYIE